MKFLKDRDWHYGHCDPTTPNTKRYWVIGAASSLLAYQLIDQYRQGDGILLPAVFAASPASQPGQFKEDLPKYTLDEVAQHNSHETQIWVTYKQGVYDITSFVAEHPGGEQILIAAGSSVEPFWMMYAAHNSTQVFDIMESMRIGNLSLEESREATRDMADPYSSDPVRHLLLKPASDKPFNAEPPPSLLVDSYYTPNELFYVRNHLPVPNIDAAQYELEIEVEGRSKTITLSLEKLKKYKKHTITATIMCAGNRRSEMVQVKPVKGLNWGHAAVGTATWSGVLLRDVLSDVGISEETAEKYNHIQFEGLDTDVTNKPYGASIPIWKALERRGDVLLAYEMNGQTIPRDHGYPIRVVVPGVVGARNVKWLGKIIVSTNESTSHWQQNDYKGFSPNTDWDTVDFTKSPAIQELPVISAICKPTDGQSIKVYDGHITVQGYAWSGGGHKIVRVDVTVDGGKTWHVAALNDLDANNAPRHWGWALWTARIPVQKGSQNVEIWSKGVDSCYNVQPESFENIWNLRGVLNNAYHRVRVNLKY